MPTNKRRRLVFLTSLLALALAAGLIIAYWDTIADHVPLLGGPIDPDLVNANNQFAFDLYAQLSSRASGDNLFFSPLSVSAIMAQAYAGARDNTAVEMKQALHFDLEPARLHPAMGALVRHLNRTGTRGGNEFTIANALWIEQTFSLLPDFIAIGRDYYGTAPRSVDFKHSAEAQRKTINDWVAEHTHGKITDLIPPGSLKAETRLVLTDAVHFKGAWKSRFGHSATRDAAFTLSDGTIVQVPMMSQSAKFRYGQQPERAASPDLQILEMPYVGEAIGMVVLLPAKVDGLAELEKSLNAQSVSIWLSKMWSCQTKVTFPRFALTRSYQLDSSLQDLGMRDAFFQKAADFSGAGTGDRLYVETVMHKAVVDVNEEGTEAAAVTSKYKIAAMPGEFKADHPFIFLIRDLRSGTILFLGRVTNPKDSSSE